MRVLGRVQDWARHYYRSKCSGPWEIAPGCTKHTWSTWITPLGGTAGSLDEGVAASSTRRAWQQQKAAQAIFEKRSRAATALAIQRAAKAAVVSPIEEWRIGRSVHVSTAQGMHGRSIVGQQIRRSIWRWCWRRQEG